MRVLPYLGVVLLWALTAVGVVFVVERAFEFDDAVIEDTRTPIPGQRVVQLEGRKYNIFFEAREIADPGRVGRQLGDPEVSPLHIRIRAEGSDRLLQLKDYSSTFTMSGSRDSTAFATVRVPRSGRYRVSVTSSEDIRFSDPTIALGEPIGGRVFSVIAAAIVTALAFIAGLLLLIVMLVLRWRRTT